MSSPNQVQEYLLAAPWYDSLLEMLIFAPKLTGFPHIVTCSLPCRRDHLKCDRLTPTCSRCAKIGRECKFDFKFKKSGLGVSCPPCPVKSQGCR